MSIELALVAALIGTGYALNKKGKQSRQEENVRTEFAKEEKDHPPVF